MSEAQPADVACRYAAGLPHLGRRPLTPHDRVWLDLRLRRLIVGTGASLGAIVGVLSAAMLWADHAPPFARPLGGGLVLGLVAIGTAGVVACLGARGWWRRLGLSCLGMLAAAAAAHAWLPEPSLPRWLTAQLLLGSTVLGLSFLGLGLARRLAVLRRLPRIRADLEQGVVDRFEGRLPPGPLDAALARLEPGGELGRHPSVRIEVLPRSGLMVRAGGKRIERWISAHLADVAPVLSHAMRVELPRGAAPAAPDPRICLKRRSLSPLERAELERHIAHLRRRWWPAAALTALVSMLVGWNLHGAAAHEGFPLDGASIGWLALLVVVYVGYGRRVLAARRLEHDRRLRWVVTVHQDSADPQRDPPTLEVLPFSRLAWTEHATPASWRTSRL